MTQCAVEFDVGIRFSVKAARGQQKTGSGRRPRLVFKHREWFALGPKRDMEQDGMVVMSKQGM